MHWGFYGAGGGFSGVILGPEREDTCGNSLNRPVHRTRGALFFSTSLNTLPLTLRALIEGRHPLLHP